MIRPLAIQRWASTALFGLVGAFVLIGAVVNLARGATRDGLLLFLFAAWLAAAGAPPWIRFVAVTDDGLVYRNWLIVRRLRWPTIDYFDSRRLYQRGGGWVVVAHRRAGGPVTLRATGRGGRRPGGAGALMVAELLDGLETARRRRWSDEASA